jgi:hypothetical protein
MNRHFWAYVGIGLAEAFLVSFMGLLVAGKVPVPTQLEWVVPAVAASLLFLTTQLPKLEAAELAAATTTTTTTTSVPVTPAPEQAAVEPAAPTVTLPATSPAPDAAGGPSTPTTPAGAAKKG